MKKYLAIVVAVALIGCAHSEEHDHSEHENYESSGSDYLHNGEHHHENLFLTAYSDKIEVFAECHPFLIGVETEILCHLTYLADFKPIENAELSAKIIVEGQETKAEHCENVESGIYHIHITATKSGKAKLLITVKTKDLNETLELADLEVFDNENDAAEFAENHEPKSINGVVFAKELSWETDFSTQNAKMQNIGSIIRSVAQILPSLDDEVILSANVNGIVNFENSNLTEGTQISYGKQICRIDASTTLESNIGLELQKAENDFNASKAEYERVATLRKDNLSLESELLEAKKNFENSKAIYESLKKNFSKSGQIVNASKSGYIKQLLVSNGEYVTVGQPIATITQNKTLRLKTEVQPSYYPELKNIETAHIRRLNSADNQTIDIRTIGGKVVSYGRQTSIENPLLPVYFDINNVGDFLPGTFVEIFIKTSSQNQRLTVPTSSILEEMGNNFLYVQITPELFEKRQIKIGKSDGIDTEILSGITENERVVAKGAMLLKLQSLSGTVDPHSGHSH